MDEKIVRRLEGIYEQMGLYRSDVEDAVKILEIYICALSRIYDKEVGVESEDFSHTVQKYLWNIDNIFITKHSDTLSDLMDITDENLFTPNEFVTEFLEELFPCPDSLEAIGLIKENEMRDQVYDLLRVLGMIYFRQEIYDKGFPEIATSLNEKTYRHYLYNSFKDSEYYDPYVNLYGYKDEESFAALYETVYGELLDKTDISVSDTVEQSIENLISEYKCTTNDIEEVFWLVKLYLTKKNKVARKYRPNRAWPYLKKLLTKKPGQLSEADRIFNVESFVKKLADTWKRTNSFSMVYRLLYNDGTDKDYQTELLITRRILRKAHKAFYWVLLVDPNPYIARYVIDRKFTDGCYNIVMIFNDHIMADIYRLEYENKVRIENDKKEVYEEKTEYLPDRILSYHYDSDKISIYTEEKRKVEFSEKFQRLILFGVGQDTTESFIKKVSLLLQFSDEAENRIVSIVPNKLIDDGERKKLADAVMIKKITSLPSKLFSGKYKKNCLMEMSVGNTDSTDIIFQQSFYYPVIRVYDSTDKINICLLDEPGMSVSAEKFCGNVNGVYKTIKQLFDDNRARPIRGKSRESARQYRLSKEITVFYSFSNGRGDLNYYKILDESNKSKRILRGNKLSGPISISLPRSKKCTEKEVHAVIREKIYKTITIIGAETVRVDVSDISIAIRKEIERYYKDQPISLKTYWIISRSYLLENRSKVYDDDLCQKVFENRHLADMMSDRTYKIETVLQWVKEAAESISISENRVLRQLNLIFGCTGIYGDRRFENQPVTGYLMSKKADKKKYREVRGSLVKKTYTVEEEKKIVQFLMEKMNDSPGAVGALICFFTGMTDKEAAALTWGDICRIIKASSSYLYFRVHRVLEENDELPERISLDNKNRFRCVPIVDWLVKILGKRKAVIEGVVSGSIANKPIVFTVKDGKAVFTKPSEIKRAKKEAEKTLKIKIVYEDKLNKNGISDYNEYHGDRFYMNADYHFHQDCGMTDGDVNYILGREQQDTYSAHYLDYQNSYVLYALKGKMERWVIKIMTSSEEPDIKAYTFSSGNLSHLNDNEECQTGELVFWRVDSWKEKDNIRVIISDDMGIDVEVTKIKRKMK